MESTTKKLAIDQRLIKALSHPLRQGILIELNAGPASPSQIARKLGEPLGNVSYHVKILAGLEAIELVDTRPVRGAVEHIYRATMRPYLDDEHWSRMPDSAKRTLLDHGLGRVCEDVAAAAEAGGFNESRAHLSRTPLRLDEEAYEDLADATNALLERAMELEAGSLARVTKADGDGRRLHETELVIMHFHRQEPEEE